MRSTVAGVSHFDARNIQPAPRTDERVVEAISKLEGAVTRLGERTAISFVDAAHVRRLVAKAADIGENDVRLNVHRMNQQVNSVTDLRILRSYLYDGAFAPKHPRHDEQKIEFDRLADTAGVQLRLGSARGTPVRQKGVDTLLVLDMLTIGRQGAYDTALLWTGDGDFSELVDQVQRLGRRVALVTDTQGSASAELTRMCDVVLRQDQRWWELLQI